MEEQVVVLMGASSGVGRGPVEDQNKSEGSFSDRAHPRSLYNWLELRPRVKRAALGTPALLRAR